MNKREGFLRQLTRELPAGELVPALETLLAEGLEVYCRKHGGVSRLLSSAEELSEEDSSVFEEVEDSLFPPHAASESTNAKHSSRAVSFFSFILIFILSLMS